MERTEQPKGRGRARAYMFPASVHANKEDNMCENIMIHVRLIESPFYCATHDESCTWPIDAMTSMGHPK